MKKKHRGTGQIRRTVNDNETVKIQINSGEDSTLYIINTKLKVRFVGQKKKHLKISEISSSALAKCSK